MFLIEFIAGMMLAYYLMSPRLRAFTNGLIGGCIVWLFHAKRKVKRPTATKVCREPAKGLCPACGGGLGRAGFDKTNAQHPVQRYECKSCHKRTNNPRTVEVVSAQHLEVESEQVSTWMARNPDLRRANGA